MQKKIILENWIQDWPGYAAFTVEPAVFSSPPQKTRQGSRNWQRNINFQRKRSSVTDVERPKEGFIVRNAKCPSALLKKELISVMNAESNPARTQNSFNLKCHIGSSFGIMWRGAKLTVISDGWRKFENIILALPAGPLISRTT